jgi:hypothetical protein
MKQRNGQRDRRPYRVDLVGRTASILLLADRRASFERQPRMRLE